MALTMDNKNFKTETKMMTHSNDKMPNVHEFLEQIDSDPQAHLVAAALPEIFASAIRAWTEFAEPRHNFSLEERVAATMNAMAVALLSHLPK